jgi:hypothetical protein
MRDDYYLPILGHYDEENSDQYYYLTFRDDVGDYEPYTEEVLGLGLDKVYEVLCDLRAWSEEECLEKGIRHSSLDDETEVEIWPRNNLCLPTPQ